MTKLESVPNIQKVAERFVNLDNQREAEWMKPTKNSEPYVLHLEHSMDEILTTVLTIAGICTYGGSRQWLREEFHKMIEKKT